MKNDNLFRAVTIKGNLCVDGQLLTAWDNITNSKSYWIINSATSRGGWVALGRKEKVIEHSIVKL